MYAKTNYTLSCGYVKLVFSISRFLVLFSVAGSNKVPTFVFQIEHRVYYGNF